MKRDMDLIRRIALATTDLEPDQCLESLDGVDASTFAMHALWMQEAGLVVADVEWSLHGGFAYASVSRLTWDGCEFADAVRDDTLWRKAREHVLKPSASFTFRSLGDWLKAQILQGLPPLV